METYSLFKELIEKDVKQWEQNLPSEFSVEHHKALTWCKGGLYQYKIDVIWRGDASVGAVLTEQGGDGVRTRLLKTYREAVEEMISRITYKWSSARDN